MHKILIIVLLLTSCASAKYKWYVDDVAVEKRKWRWCHNAKDDPKLHDKGICYVSRRCRKRFLARPKCERVQLYCAHGNVDCLRENKWPMIRRGGDAR